MMQELAGKPMQVNVIYSFANCQKEIKVVIYQVKANTQVPTDLRKIYLGVRQSSPSINQNNGELSNFNYTVGKLLPMLLFSLKITNLSKLKSGGLKKTIAKFNFQREVLCI